MRGRTSICLQIREKELVWGTSVNAAWCLWAIYRFCYAIKFAIGYALMQFDDEGQELVVSF